MQLKSELNIILCSMGGKTLIDWIGYDSCGRAQMFRAPDDWSMARACRLCELLYPDFGVVTLRTL